MRMVFLKTKKIMKNNNKLIILVILVLITAVTGIFLLIRNDSNPTRNIEIFYEEDLIPIVSKAYNEGSQETLSKLYSDKYMVINIAESEIPQFKTNLIYLEVPQFFINSDNSKLLWISDLSNFGDLEKYNVSIPISSEDEIETILSAGDVIDYTIIEFISSGESKVDALDNYSNVIAVLYPVAIEGTEKTIKRIDLYSFPYESSEVLDFRSILISNEADATKQSELVEEVLNTNFRKALSLRFSPIWDDLTEEQQKDYYDRVQSRQI